MSVRRDVTAMTDSEYMGHVAALGCVICRKLGMGPQPAQVHHPRTGAGAGRKRPHKETIPLCPQHHQWPPVGLHHLGRKEWERKFKVVEDDLVWTTRSEIEQGDE